MFCILIIVMVTCVDFTLVLYILVIILMLDILYKIQLSYLFLYSFNQSFKNITSLPCANLFTVDAAMKGQAQPLPYGAFSPLVVLSISHSSLGFKVFPHPFIYIECYLPSVCIFKLYILFPKSILNVTASVNRPFVCSNLSLA